MTEKNDENNTENQIRLQRLNEAKSQRANYSNLSKYILIALFVLQYCINFVYSLPFEYYDGGELLKSNTSSSLETASEACGCDLKPNSCDPYCCCDPICNNYKNGTLQWRFFSECWSNPVKAQRFPRCKYDDYQVSLKDLYSPLRVVSQNYKKGLCVSFDNSGLNNSLNIKIDREKESFINTTLEFDSFVQDEDIKFINETFPYLKDSSSVTRIFPLNQDKFFNSTEFRNYSVGDNIVIFDSQSKYKSLKQPYKGVYGECEHNFSTVKFLSQNKITCGQKLVRYFYYSNYYFSYLINYHVKGLIKKQLTMKQVLNY